MKIKKSTFYGIIIVLILIIGIWYYQTTINADPYHYENGKMSYDQSRPTPKFALQYNSSVPGVDIYYFNFTSRPYNGQETIVFGLLLLPQGKKNVPGIVFLPGGGVKKEGIVEFSSRLVQEGYAVITIDQRGIGQTTGAIPSTEQDYATFQQGGESLQHLMVYDALAAYDILRLNPAVNKNKILFAGESMGGRYALVAAALETRSKGVFVISSSGFHIPITPSKPESLYYHSIDPDTYLTQITPRPIFMMHGTNDTVIPLAEAKETFALAREPKELFIAENCTHGFCEAMWPEIKKAASRIISTE